MTHRVFASEDRVGVSHDFFGVRSVPRRTGSSGVELEVDPSVIPLCLLNVSDPCRVLVPRARFDESSTVHLYVVTLRGLSSAEAYMADHCGQGFPSARRSPDALSACPLQDVLSMSAQLLEGQAQILTVSPRTRQSLAL